VVIRWFAGKEAPPAHAPAPAHVDGVAIVAAKVAEPAGGTGIQANPPPHHKV
jgi:hypothetical protein